MRLGLKAKFVVAVAVVLTGFSLASTWTNIRAQQEIARDRLLGKARALTSLLAAGASEPLALLQAEDLRFLLENVRDQTEVADAVVFDEDGMVITDGTRQNPERFRSLSGETSRSSVAASATLVRWAPGRLEVTEPVWLGSEKIGGVRVGFGLGSLDAEIATIRDENVLLGVAFVAVGVLIALALVVTVTRPLQRLIDFTEALGRGEFDRRVDVRSGDELEILGSSFNAMAESLGESQRSLQVAHDDLERRITERTADLVRTNEMLEQQMQESRELEDQLRQSQKMEAVGRLAAGVAHDFNNLLTVILGYANLLQAELEPDSPHRAGIEEVRLAGERAASLTDQLLTFGRRQVVQEDVIDMNVVVAGMETLVRRLVGEDVDVSFELASGLDCIRADPSQVEQVILNLAVNARDAMYRGGRLIVRTEGFEGEVGSGPRRESGRWVVLSVRDNGAGMDAQTLDRIFEPFFTTKEWGAGTGLGLSTVYGIVEQARGHIEVESTPRQGALFRVFLPGVDASEVAVGAREEAEVSLAGWETVLVAEDEDVVRRLACHTLERLGYRVLEARNGDEALALEKREGGRIHLLLSDVAMPGMRGPELARRLVEARPDLRVLYTSGYAKGADPELTREGAFLKKPFTPQGLGRAVRDALDGRA